MRSIIKVHEVKGLYGVAGKDYHSFSWQLVI